MAYRLLLGVVEAVSEARDVGPLELEPRLEDCVDTEALRRPVAHDGGVWTPQFTFSDHEVTVASDGRISVDGERANRWNRCDDDTSSRNSPA